MKHKLITWRLHVLGYIRFIKTSSLNQLIVGFILLAVSFIFFSAKAYAIAPDTSIDSNPNVYSTSVTPTFVFSSTDVLSTFECSVDGGAYSPCTSPYTTSVLTDGQHSFSVQSTNALDETDLSPASYSWTISTFDGGDGSSGSPYQISTCTQLQTIEDNMSASYELVGSVLCRDFDFSSIGDSVTNFTGTFDGQGNFIFDLTISETVSDVGLFGGAAGANIRNFILYNASVTSTVAYVGAVVGDASAGTVIESVHVYNSTITANSMVGGLVGELGGSTITLSFFDDGQIISDGSFTGGLVGYLVGPSSASNSYATGTIDVTANPGNMYIGGLIGSVGIGPTVVQNNYAAVEFVNLTQYVGGLIGDLSSFAFSVTNNFSASDLTAGGGIDVGGFIGRGNSGGLANNYFDSTRAARTNCGGDNAASCSAVSDSNYFINNDSNAPFDQWDFGGPTGLWHKNHDGYPTLKPLSDPTMLCEEPQRTLNSIAATCDYTDQGWGTTTWEAAYREAGFGDWIPIELDDIYRGRAVAYGVSSDTEYEIRLRYTNDWGTSPWGVNVFSVEDTDGDGSSDQIEQAGFNGGDANNDGTPDYQQANVYSVVSIVNGKYVVLATPNCNDNFNAQIGGESGTVVDADYDYPAGLVGFVGRGCGAAGSAIPVEMYFYGDYDASSISLRKYSSASGYIKIPNATLEEVTIDGEQVMKASYSVVDGGELDDDGAADGNISDPAGLAVDVRATQATPIAPNTGFKPESPLTNLLIVLLGASVLVVIRKSATV